MWTLTRSATPAPAKAAAQRADVGRKVGPGHAEHAEAGLRRHAGLARGPCVQVGKARHRHVHRHLLMRDRRPVDEREQRAGARDEGQVDLRVAPVDGEDGRAATAHPIGAATGGCGWPTGVSPSGRSSSSTPTNRAPSARSRSTISASAGATGSGHVWSSRIAPSPWAEHPVDRAARDLVRRATRIPLVDLDVPADVPVAELAEPVHEVGAIRARAERKARPRPRVGARRLDDHALGLPDVLREAVVAQQRHPRVIEGMVADEVAFRGDATGQVGEGLHPSALEEDRCAHVQSPELVEDPSGVRPVMRAVGVLGVEGEGDPRAVAHFSTPVMTMPRMKARCAKKKTTIGMHDRHQRRGLDVLRL